MHLAVAAHVLHVHGEAAAVGHAHGVLQPLERRRDKAVHEKVHRHDARHDEREEQESLARDVLRDALVIGRRRHHDADHPVQVAQFKALLRTACDIPLARRSTVARHAAGIDAQRRDVTQRALAVERGHLVVGREGGILPEALHDLGLELVGGMCGVARAVAHVADLVVGILREVVAHAQADDGAVQPLEVVVAVAIVVDAILVDGHEVPHGVELARKHAGLLAHGRLSLLALRRVRPRHVQRHEQRDDHDGGHRQLVLELPVRHASPSPCPATIAYRGRGEGDEGEQSDDSCSVTFSLL